MQCATPPNFAHGFQLSHRLLQNNPATLEIVFLQKSGFAVIISQIRFDDRSYVMLWLTIASEFVGIERLHDSLSHNTTTTHSTLHNNKVNNKYDVVTLLRI